MILGDDRRENSWVGRRDVDTLVPHRTASVRSDPLFKGDETVCDGWCPF
jgi:hypothetical protein